MNKKSARSAEVAYPTYYREYVRGNNIWTFATMQNAAFAINQACCCLWSTIMALT